MKYADYDALSDLEKNKLVAKTFDRLDDGFLCPRCGGTYFGSSAKDGEITERWCHGPPHGCGWHGPPQDAPPDFVGDGTVALNLLEWGLGPYHEVVVRKWRGSVMYEIELSAACGATPTIKGSGKDLRELIRYVALLSRGVIERKPE